MQKPIWKQERFWLLVPLLVLIYFPVFMRMDVMPLRPWDESILGINTMEMMDNHNPIVTYFYGKPDMSNCKPPLAIWLMALCSKVFGFSEFSLRLPSALAAFTLCVYLFFAIGKHLRSYVFSFLVVAVLVSCQGYVRNHVIRTGEYDSLLVLFTALFSLHLFFATEAEEVKQWRRHLLLFFIFLTLAVLTKGIACMMLAPGLFLYVLARKKLLLFLKERNTYFGLGIFLVFGLGYYFLREAINPGYLVAVWENELGGRFAGPQGHPGAATFYLYEILGWQFDYYKFLFPAALACGLLIAEPKLRRLTAFSFCTSVFFLLVISTAQTKLSHYDAPLFPFLAIIMAGLIFQLYLLLRDSTKNLRPWRSAAIAGFVCLCLLANPYYETIKKVYAAKGDSWDEGFSKHCGVFRLAIRNHITVNHFIIPFDWIVQENSGEYNILNCYRRVLSEHEITMNLASLSALSPTDTVMSFGDWNKHLINEKYYTRDLNYYKEFDGYYLVVDSVKTAAP